MNKCILCCSNGKKVVLLFANFGAMHHTCSFRGVGQRGATRGHFSHALLEREQAVVASAKAIAQQGQGQPGQMTCSRPPPAARTTPALRTAWYSTADGAAQSPRRPRR